MYTISSALYNEVVSRLCERVGGDGYFSGSTEFEFEGIECRLVLSAVVYHHRQRMPEGEFDTVADMVPVWWEFHTADEQGEMLNDFSFGELRKYFDR